MKYIISILFTALFVLTLINIVLHGDPEVSVGLGIATIISAIPLWREWE
jgi:hypothetical protein